MQYRKDYILTNPIGLYTKDVRKDGKKELHEVHIGIGMCAHQNDGWETNCWMETGIRPGRPKCPGALENIAPDLHQSTFGIPVGDSVT
jgi:hypothetical protein